MRGPLIIAAIVLAGLFTVMIVGQRSAPTRSSSGVLPGVPVIRINQGFQWIPDEPAAGLGDVSVVRVSDRARIYNTRGEWVPCTLTFYDTEQKGIGCARIDLPHFGAVSAILPTTDRAVGFMEITIPMAGCALDPEGGAHTIGYGSDPLSIPLLKEWGFLKEGAACPESAILQDATDISGSAFVLIVVGRTVSYSFPVESLPGTTPEVAEASRLKVATDMIAKVREEDAAAAALDAATKQGK